MDHWGKWQELYLDIDEGGESDKSDEDLMYMFIDQTDLDVEEVYSLVFMKGRKIIWH